MSFDEELKQAFERRAGDVSPTPGAWAGVQRRIRRSHRIRAALATAGGAAAIVAAAFVVPSLLNKPGLTPQPPATQAPTPAVQDGAIFRNQRDGYWLRYPKDWRFGEFEAHVSFQPPGLASVEEGSETFVVELWVDAGRYDDPDRLGTSNNSGLRAEDTIVAGRNAKVVEVESSGHIDGQTPVTTKGKVRTYYVDWTRSSCESPAASCPVGQEPSLLIVSVRAASSMEPLWDRYGEAGEGIVASIRSNDSSTMPSGLSVATRRGSVSSSVVYDDSTSVVVDFMEARIEGGGAETRLTPGARSQYASGDGGLSLYSPNETTTYTSYTVVAREGADASSFEYVVRISYIKIGSGGSPDQRGFFEETLGVGPGTTSPGSTVIRFATRGPDQPTSP